MKNNNCIKEWQKQTIRDENMMKKKIIERGGEEFKRNRTNIRTRRGDSAEKIVGKGELFTWKNRKKSERR